jgi:hypothetical protein
MKATQNWREVQPIPAVGRVQGVTESALELASARLQRGVMQM